MDKNEGKKTFDKKKWRENKYNKKVRVERWKTNREKSVKRKYLKMLSKESGFQGTSSKNANLEPLGEKKPKSMADVDENSKDENPKSDNQGLKSFAQTKMEFERRQKKAEKQTLRDEKQRRYLEKQEAIKAYKQKKSERYKILSKKNKRGQPIMSGRIELLLDKIRKDTNQ